MPSETMPPPGKVSDALFPVRRPAPKPVKQRTLIKRTAPPKRVNAKRKRSEFTRCYGSRERVAFVKSLPCLVCMAVAPIFGEISMGRSHNAHTVNGGRGRKGDYITIVPLCPSHHRRYDEHLPPCDTPESRDALKNLAAEVERRWQEEAA